MSNFLNQENLKFLYGWIRFNDIASVSEQLENNKDYATSISSLLFVSPILKTSLDGNFATIAKWFFENHLFSEDLISLIHCIVNNRCIDIINFNDELFYSFFDRGVSATINEMPKHYAPLREVLENQIKNLDDNMTPIIVVYGKNYYLDIIYPILKFLLNTVEHIVNELRSYQSLGGSLFLRQTAPCKFLSHLEVKVAESIFDKSFYQIDNNKNDIIGMYPADVINATPFQTFEKEDLYSVFNFSALTKRVNNNSVGIDGFVSTSELDVGDNVDYGINTISTYANHSLGWIKLLPKPHSKNILVDKYWGFVYNEYLLAHDFSIYGNEKVPVNFSEKASAGYLRVPFRKIPRINIYSPEELIKIIKEVTSAYNFGGKILLRGQSSEYYLGRDHVALKRLYNDENALELSLLPSSARSSESFEDIYPIWSFLINHFKTKMNIPIPEELNFMRFMYNLSLAQHYGLPSCGLDLTDDIGTALFFALNEYIGGSPSKYIRKKTGESVIYILECGNQDVMPYSVFKSDNEISRPKAQSAYFFSTGWGFSNNRAARQVRAAIYFDASIVFPQEKSVEDLFPKEDCFINYLKSLKENCTLPDSINKWLDKIYFI